METDVHKWLKRIGCEFLKEKGMNAIANEVAFKCGISDCCGIQFKRKEVRIIECKATKADFIRDKKLFSLERSYYPECHYFYIICPYGVIDKDLVVPGIGLIYVKDDDTYEVIKKPFKNSKRLKTLFETTMKHLIHRLSNEVFYKKEKEYKDVTENKYARKADIYLSAVRCPKCKHVTKELISKKKTKEITCSHCHEKVDLSSSKVREITGFNDKFIKRMEELL